MATNTNGITTFWDFTSWYLDNVNPDQSGNEDVIAVMLAMMFTILGKEIPSNWTTDNMKLLGQECPTKDEIETWLENSTATTLYINNASSYANNQLIKYSDLRNAEAAEDSITVIPTSLTIPWSGMTDINNVTVTCSGSWTASTTTSWINLSKTSGTGNGTLTVSADRYTGTTSRLGSVIFKSGSQTCGLRVTQERAPTVK